MSSTRKNYESHCMGISLEQLLVSLLIISLLNIAAFEFYGTVIKKILLIKTELTMLYKKNIISFLLRNNIMRSGCKGFGSRWLLPEYTNISMGYQILPEAPIAVCKASRLNLNCLPFVNNKIMHKISTEQIKPNTDILVVYDIPVSMHKLSENMLNNTSHLQIDTKYIEDLNIGDHLIIYDYQCLQRFIISGIIQNRLLHGYPYNNNNDLIKTFKKNTKLLKVKHLAFYIAQNQGKRKNIYSLYMDDLSSSSNHAIAIADHVENFVVKVPIMQEKIQLLDAADLGWLYNEKYIIINLLFKNKYIDQPEKKHFAIGVEIRNSN